MIETATYLSVTEVGQPGAGAGQQEVSAEDGHLVPKLHVGRRAVGGHQVVHVDHTLVDQAGRVDDLGDLCQRPLAAHR